MNEGKESIMEDQNPLLLESQICFKIYTLEREITKLYRNLLEDLDMTYPQYLVMLLLWEKDAMTVKEIGKRLFLDSGTLTPMLKRMEANGIIKRRRSTEDERSVIISLTKKGEQFKKKAECIPSKLVEDMSLDHGELTILNKTLTNMLYRLQGQTTSN
ncbi:MarR family winged helix-turn-helix transcriptional regulator [Fictibacillus sp. BK138]|uniref:MarR family winged helix-turn-helix transcriptional regulator n=1 Tax=Fictibacillus sp. BK138 TaxID=2512121 RepID=UPI001F5FA10F|nr:MarR family transcriptional regulator [Fictibacillus sp. BK138]